jgi:UDPglucose 6-dehydrogenase
LFERNSDKIDCRLPRILLNAVKHASIIFLALPTPPGEDGSADLKYVLGVADQLGKLLKAIK